MSDSAQSPQPIKRRRGRPRKFVVEEKPKRPVGRPRKYDNDEDRVAAKKEQMSIGYQKYTQLQKQRIYELSKTDGYVIVMIPKEKYRLINDLLGSSDESSRDKEDSE